METIVRILRGRTARHIYAAIAVVLVLLLRVTLAEHSITLPTYVTFYPVVFLAAVLGGISEGILATTLSALLADYFLIEPFGSFAIRSTSDIAGMAIFCVAGVTISVVTGLYHHRRERQAASTIERAVRNERGKAKEAGNLAEAVRAERLRFLDVLESLRAIYGSSNSSETALIDRELFAAGDESRLPTLDQASFRASLRWTVAFPFIAALILAGAALWAAYNLNSSMQRVDRTDQVIGQSGRLLTLLVNMETSERGYLVTGNDVFLQPYREASKEVDSEYQKLYLLIADNPPQQSRLEQLHNNLHHWQGYAEQMIALRRVGGAYSDLSINLAGKGEVDIIREQIAGFQSVEEHLRDERNRAAHRDWRLIAVICIVSGLGGGFGIAIFTLRRMEIIADSFEKSRCALAESERRWATTLASIGDAVMAASSDGRITFLNPVAVALTGWQPEDAIGQPIQKVFHILNEQTRTPAEDIVYRVLTEGRTFELANHTALVTKDGREIPIADSAAPILESNGAVAGVVLVFRDVTERRRADDALREVQAKMAAALASMTDSVIITDVEGRFVDFNDAFATFYRFKSKAECARSFEEFASLVDVMLANGRQAPQELYAIQRALRGETATNAEYTLRRKDTGESWIGSLSFGPIRSKDGAIIGSVVTSREITEAKRVEGERQIAVDFLAMVNQSQGTNDLLQRATTFFQQRSGCEAVGLRLREGEDYPYFESRGFSDEFVHMESRLCVRTASGKVLKDNTGNAILECFCGNVIRGRVEVSKPFYTSLGSFWSNSTTDLIAGAREDDFPQSTRHRCNREGYESVALFPLYVGEERLGLLQLVDRRKGRFSAQNIVLWEKLAGHLATAVSKFRAEEALQESEKRYRNLFKAMNEGFCIIEVLFDADGKPEDYRFLEVNEAFEQQTGLHDAVGKRMRELAPAHEAHWFEIYGKIALTGEPAQFINEAKALNRVYDVHAYRVGEPEQRRVAIVFNDFSDYKRAEEALQRSEAQFRNLANAIPQLCWMANADGWIFWYNERWYEYTGTTPKQMEGWGWQSVHDPEALPQVMERWTGSIATGNPFEMEFPIRGADSVFRPFLTRVMPVKDSDGRVVRWFGTNTDITGQKLAEEELKKLNRTLKALSNSNQAISHATDEKTFLTEVCRIITRDCGHAMVWIGIAEHDERKTVRPAANAGFDESYLETLGVTWDESERGFGPTGTAIRTGQPSVCRNILTDAAFAPWREEAIKRGYASSLVIPLKEEKKAWGAITIYSREPDAFSEGEINLLTELAGDLEFGIQTLRLRAARTQAEEALRESKEHLGLFVDHAPAALAMFDKELRYLYVSRRWMADYNLGDRELRGLSHYDVFPAVSDEWREAHRRGLAGEVLSRDAERFARADGTEQWIRWEIRPWHNADGEVGGIVIFSEEITERKKAEAALLRSEKLAFQRQKLQALAARLQHAREEERKMVARDLHDDIGQILTAIKMDITWVVRHLPKSTDEVHKRLAGSIELINNGAQSVRKICSGLRPGILDDLGLAATIEWQMNEFASRTGISCQVSFPPAELKLDGDHATAVFRIFQECLTNVARHAEARSVRASLSQQDENLMLVVVDDGKGFRESEVAGSLGILGMKERAQACGGSVQVSSSPSKGTKITVQIPLNAASAERKDDEHSNS
jgi:PAS domain S-box-containing protein